MADGWGARWFVTEVANSTGWLTGCLAGRKATVTAAKRLDEIGRERKQTHTHNVFHILSLTHVPQYVVQVHRPYVNMYVHILNKHKVNNS